MVISWLINHEIITIKYSYIYHEPLLRLLSQLLILDVDNVDGIYIYWLVVWNMNSIFPNWDDDHPNWLSYFSEGLTPPTSIKSIGSLPLHRRRSSRSENLQLECIWQCFFRLVYAPKLTRGERGAWPTKATILASIVIDSSKCGSDLTKVWQATNKKMRDRAIKQMQTMLCFVAPPKVSVESLSRWPPSKDFGLSLVPKISSDDCSHKSLELEEEQNKEVKNIQKHLIKIMVSCKSSPKIRFFMVVLSIFTHSPVPRLRMRTSSEKIWKPWWSRDPRHPPYPNMDKCVRENPVKMDDLGVPPF